MSEKIKPNLRALSGLGITVIVVGIVSVAIFLLFEWSGLLILTVLISLYFLYRYLSLRRTEYILTDDKVISNVDFGGETHEEVGFDKIQNTQVKIPFLYQLYGNYGTVSISTAGSNLSAITLSAIENPNSVHKQIVNRINEDRSESKEVEESGHSNEYKKLREASRRLRTQIEGGKYE